MMTPELIRTINDQLESMEFGQLQIVLKRHLGDTNPADMVKMTNHYYKDVEEPNVAIATDIYRLLKSIQDSNQTGSLSFTTTFDRGKAKIMQVQDFKRL